MFSLPNGCSRSEISVTPKNWNKATASTKKPWKITYRFYDPAYQFTELWGKQVQIKGMNHLKLLVDRQDSTQTLLDFERDRLQLEGYNPITGISIPPILDDEELGPNTFLKPALQMAFKRLNCADGTKEDIEIALPHILSAVRKLKFEGLPVGEVRIRNIILILEAIGKAKDGWTASNYNHYRSYLLMLFKVIVPMANMQGNPVKDVPKKKEVKGIKDVLTDKQRVAVNDYLLKNKYNFWRFLHIFFHSGARITEMMRLKVTDVDLPGQRFKVLILKGNIYEEVWKPIKSLALPLWVEVVNECKGLPIGQPIYLFSRHLVPGVRLIDEIQITRRWRKIKKILCITADFYSLKHLNSTETVDQLSTGDAAAMNSHKSEAMVVNIYDVKAEQRQFERLKKVNNPFVK